MGAVSPRGAVASGGAISIAIAAGAVGGKRFARVLSATELYWICCLIARTRAAFGCEEVVSSSR